MGETVDSRVEEALAMPARRDKGEAEAARSAFGSLTFGAGLDSVTLYGLQYWLWYQLPTKWWTDLAEHLQIAAALGALFQHLRLPRYAAVCASDTTTQVISAWRQSRQSGFTALNKAMSASGVEPPDVEGVLVWGKVMGLHENDAFQLAAAQLEATIAADELVPGTRGWRAVAEQVTRECLTVPCAVPGGGSWLEAIHGERMETWAMSRGAARKRLAEAVMPQLETVPGVPEGAAERLAPVRWWLLDLAAAEGGVPLTANHNLARTVLARVVSGSAGSP
ncbi:hypothetical protein [Sphaerisporangium sp. NPDC051011]|uniref:hypothetical protein n=1 Tax=Sphaerisporangium sp. NPDC051011 TaxID=3155792 RepID=UPI0033D16158